MISDKLNRKFGLITSGASLVISAWRFIVHHHTDTLLPLTGILLLLCTLLSPRMLTPLHSAWNTLGNVLGMINTTVILFVLYFLLITPIGLILRLINKTVLNQNFDTGAATYWKLAKLNGQSSMKQQF